MTRPSAQARGYGWRWQKARETYIASHRWCVMHLRKGQNVQATVVDHINAPRMKEAIESGEQERIAKAQSLFWDKGNWQALCAHCHNSVKQSHESGGAKAACNEDGVPLSFSHHWRAPEIK